jgi:hypothetical protein
MSDHDTLRWGGSEGIQVFGGQTGTTPQIVHAHWQRPLAWKLLLIVVPQLDPTESGTFAVALQASIGIGQGVITVTIPVGNITASAPGMAPALIFNLDVPAQDVNLQATVDGSAASGEGTNNRFTVSIFMAPLTEPRVMADIRDALCNPAGYESRALSDPDHRGQERWMPPGFDDGMLRHR